MWTSYWKICGENQEPSQPKTSSLGITAPLICPPWDPLVLVAEIFPVPRLPHCRLCSFPCISLLISLRLQCLSHYEIFIFSIPLADGSGSFLQSFEGNLNLLNTSAVGLCLGSIISGWKKGSGPCSGTSLLPLGDPQIPQGTAVRTRNPLVQLSLAVSDRNNSALQGALKQLLQ